MASNGDEVRQGAIRELARRELARRQREFKGPIPTGAELAAGRSTPPKLGLIETARLTMTPTQRLGLGIGEAALSMGSGMLSAPLNSLWNAGMEAMELPTDQPVGTYMPRGQEGQAIVSSASRLVEPVAKLIERGTDVNNPDPAVRATGHIINAALGVAPGVGTLRAARARRAAIPTRGEIKVAANQAYQRAEAAGGMLPQSNLGGFVQRAEKMLTDEGFDRQLNPNTYAAVTRFYDEATNPAIQGHSAQGAEVLRRVLLNAEKQAAPGSQDAMLAGKLVDEFDDFMDTQGMPATPEYAQARALWQTQRKAQDIEAIFERARNQAGQFSVSGAENALRTQFKQLADNPKRFNRFNAAEKEAILKVVRGGVAQNTLRFFGKFFPNGTVPFIAAATAEAALPGAGLGIATAGAVGRGASSALRTRSARRVDELVRSGAIPVMGPSRLPGSQSLPQIGYLPAYSNALYREPEEPENALKRR